MTEQKFQKKIIDQYSKQGYFVVNTIKTNVTGIPDLILLKAGELPMFIECKKEKGVISEIQKYRLEQLDKQGFDVFVSYGDKIIHYKELDI